MKILAVEVYPLINALEARIEWIKDDDDAPQEEIVYLENFLRRVKNIRFACREESQ